MNAMEIIRVHTHYVAFMAMEVEEEEEERKKYTNNNFEIDIH